MNRYYGTDYALGDQVKVNGRSGVIVPRPDYIGEHYVAVRFNEAGREFTGACHPTWEFEVIR